MKKVLLIMALVCMPLLASAQTENGFSSDSLLISEWYDIVFNGYRDSDNILDKYLSSEVKNKIWTEDYDGCYEYYRFRTTAQDYESEEKNISRIGSISDLGNGWYEVKYLDMGNKGTTRVRIEDNKIVDFVQDSSWDSWDSPSDYDEESLAEEEAEPAYETAEAEKAYDAVETKDNTAETSQEDEGWSISDIFYGVLGLIILGLLFGKGKSSSSNGLSSLFKDIMSSSSSSQPATPTNTYQPSQNKEYKPAKKADIPSSSSNNAPSYRTITVSVTCTNCGSTVVMNFRTDRCGGFSSPCYNCSGNVTGTYSWGTNDNIIIRNVKTMGGARK